ncbi:hypothetical protein VFPBJ_11742 [Purpureocillium lilacinum]|uniref:Uncharacterized protein n=1 Tax=Purpureocillium lilacinum TaxID=33203 RepID=A0A179EX78_PURLI|nr:hypothetical protein VFPBJ_11742 [Purpureocillium lilacinum]
MYRSCNRTSRRPGGSPPCRAARLRAGSAAAPVPPRRTIVTGQRVSWSICCLASSSASVRIRMSCCCSWDASFKSWIVSSRELSAAITQKLRHVLERRRPVAAVAAIADSIRRIGRGTALLRRRRFCGRPRRISAVSTRLVPRIVNFPLHDPTPRWRQATPRPHRGPRTCGQAHLVYWPTTTHSFLIEIAIEALRYSSSLFPLVTGRPLSPPLRG